MPSTVFRSWALAPRPTFVKPDSLVTQRLIVAQIEMPSQDRPAGSTMVALALRARTPAEAQRHRRAT